MWSFFFVLVSRLRELISLLFLVAFKSKIVRLRAFFFQVLENSNEIDLRLSQLFRIVRMNVNFTNKKTTVMEYFNILPTDKQRELIEYTTTALEEQKGYEPEASDLHHILFNESPYIIGTYRAKKWLEGFVFE